MKGSIAPEKFSSTGLYDSAEIFKAVCVATNGFATTSDHRPVIHVLLTLLSLIAKTQNATTQVAYCGHTGLLGAVVHEGETVAGIG